MNKVVGRIVCGTLALGVTVGAFGCAEEAPPPAAGSCSRPPAARATRARTRCSSRPSRSSSDLGLRPKEYAFDGGFRPHATRDALAPLEPETVFIAGRPHKRSRRSQRRLLSH